MGPVAVEQRAQRVGVSMATGMSWPVSGPYRAKGRPRGGCAGCRGAPSSPGRRRRTSSPSRGSCAGGTRSPRRRTPGRPAPSGRSVRLGRLQRGGDRVGVPVIGRHGAVLDEVPSALLQGRHVAVVVVDVPGRRLAEALDGVRPARPRGLEVDVGAERRHHPGAQPRDPRRAGRARRGRRPGRRSWPARRSRTGAAVPGAGGPARRAARRSGRTGRRRSPRSAVPGPRRSRPAHCRTSTAPGCRAAGASSRTAAATPRAHAPPAAGPRPRPAGPGSRRRRAAAASRSGRAGRTGSPGRRRAGRRPGSAGSTWPWGETIGRFRTASYRRRATARVAASAGSSRSGCTVSVAMARGWRLSQAAHKECSLLPRPRRQQLATLCLPGSTGGNHRRKSDL